MNEPTCCSSSPVLTFDVVEACTVPVAPTASNIVLSEYVVNGEGVCPSVDCVAQDTCQAGEAIEITNQSNCPVTLDGFHFAYRNANASAGSHRWMNFGAADVALSINVCSGWFTTSSGGSGIRQPLGHGQGSPLVTALTLDASLSALTAEKADARRDPLLIS